MNEILLLLNEFFKLLKQYEIWAYVLLGIIAFFFVQRLVNAIDDIRIATFQLEKETAIRRFRSALMVLILLFTLAGIIFISVTFIAPTIPWDGKLPTPTLDLLTTPTLTLEPTEEIDLFPGEVTPTLAASGCTTGMLEWTFPLEGDEISGVIEPRGTVNFPTLGFYKYEVAALGSDDWKPISAGKTIIIDQNLGGSWNTESETPGDYQLRLVATDSQNNYLPPCIINVRIQN